MSPGRFRVALFIALLTAAVALLLRFESARYEATGAASSCAKLGSECDAVQTSAYAKVMGVSLATWGALGALVLASLLLLSRKEPSLLVFAGAVAALSVGGVLYTAFAAWVKLGKFCLYCSVMQAGFLALAVLVGPAAWRARGLVPRRPLRLGGAMAAFLLALALSGEAYARERIRLVRTFTPPGKGMRLDISDALLLGDPTTRISVVLFFDFGCPFCRECCRKAAELVRRHPRCVHFWLKHYPLERECNRTLSQTMHATACRGALAGQAAQAKKLDAQALGVIFGYQEDQFGKLVLARIGEDLGVPAGEWAELLAAPRTKEIVDRDIAEGNALNLLVVPVAFVNGRQVDTQRLADKIGQLCR